MKKILLSILSVITLSLCHAQSPVLWGMTPGGGIFGGTLFDLIDSGTETVLHNFGNGNDGQIPNGSLIQASNGLLYGMTSEGGVNNEGTIFSYNISTGKDSTLHSFVSDTDGSVPDGSLICASNGLFYGMTSEGGTGAYGSGTIFSYDIYTGKETVLHNFGNIIGPNQGVDTDDGNSPTGSLIQANNGLLYGMTSAGGDYDSGTIFVYNISTDKYTILHNFGIGTDGKIPYGSVIQATNGLIYGMTSEGGVNNDGIIFSYDITTGGENDIYDFGPPAGVNPHGSLIQASDGYLYGMTSQGGAYSVGLIFYYNITLSTEISIYAFGNGNAGSYPYGSLIQATNGLFYGMTQVGGANGSGIIFSLKQVPNQGFPDYAETDIYDFGSSDTDGINPLGDLLEPVCITPPNANICEGSGSSIRFTASGASTYTWTPSTGLSATTGDSVIANPSISTTYTVIGTLGGQVDTLTITALVNPNPTLSVSQDTSILLGDSVQLIANSNGSVTWSPSTGLNCTNCSNPVAAPTITTTYTASAAQGSCNISDSVIITVKTSTSINQLSVNNSNLSIYPNPSSGQFTVQLNGNLNDYTAEVYNVMGIVIYQSFLSNSQNNINLNSQPSGIYFIYLKSEKDLEIGKIMITKS